MQVLVGLDLGNATTGRQAQPPRQSAQLDRTALTPLLKCALVFLFLVAATACSDQEEGVRQRSDGPVASITDDEVCLSFGGRCYEINDDTEIVEQVEEGDIASVHALDGVAVKIEVFPLDD